MLRCAALAMETRRRDERRKEGRQKDVKYTMAGIGRKVGGGGFL